MHRHHSSQLSLRNHFFLISVLAVAAIVGFAELGKPLLSANDAAIKGDVKPVSAPGSILTYRWNLDDHARPLLTLPDRINETLDLSITYSLDQFQFPFLQTLYYNKLVGKYILMVMPKAGGRAEFIDLAPVNGSRAFAAKGNSKLRLEDRGYAKLLTTGEGTVYTFARFGDGEFHCSQIKDRHGSVIILKYKENASIDRIVDISGRTISFGYEKDYVSSITQTWGSGAVIKQTWSIADSAIAARRTVNLIPAAGAEILKRLPKNALTRAYTPAMAASDLMLAAIFGGPGAVAAAHSFEPRGLGKQYPLYRGDLMGDDGKRRRGHLTFAMHLYGNANGTSDTDIYVPSGFTSHSTTPTPTDAAVTFYYPRLGSLTDVTLAVFHIRDFRLIDEGQRVRIGKVGGPGGSIACYRHAHLEFYRGKTGLPSAASRPRLRVDPATVFATTSNLASLTRPEIVGRLLK